MSVFERKFHHRNWTDLPVIGALFDQWALPGRPSANSGLRVAVRKNYLNFYRRGQSVAKLHSTNRLLRLSVHEEYAANTTWQTRGDTKLTGYAQFDEDWLSEERNASSVLGWIETAETYAGAEKSYVDELVAANPGTIDIEMGLPAYDGEVNAPRMDLVLIEDNPTFPCLAFWEAKCADNSEARAHGVPKVVDQVRKYERWMDKPGRKKDVVAAYREAAKILLKLADDSNKPTGAAQDIWRRFTKAASPTILGTPGVVIGGYCPAGYRKGYTENIEQRAKSLLERGHKDRLTKEFGLKVVYHATLDKTLDALPSLAGPSL